MREVQRSFYSFTFLIMEKISDSELWSRAVQYGEAARKWRQRFLGLLPEIARRELWRAHGFESVFVFAFKIGGVSKEQVERVLMMEERLRDKPLLHEMLVSGEVSMNKIVRVVSVATPENEEELAGQVKLLAKASVETLVRDMKAYGKITEPQDKSENVSNHFSFVPGHSSDEASLGLGQEVISKLQELKQKGIDINEAFLTFLKQREQEIMQAKENIATEMETQATKSSSRYIPKTIKSLLKKEFGTKCAISNCKKLSQDIHHTARYSIIRNHNPNFLAPLCKQHHQIAHSIDVKVQKIKTGHIGNT